MATFKMQRARGDFGHVPSKVLEALVKSSREDLGAAYRRLDYCHQLAPGGLSQFHSSVRDYLTGQGFTAAEARTVADHVCGPRQNPGKRRPSVVKPVAHPAWSVMRSVYRPKKAKKRNPEQGPVNILATYGAADVGKHPILDAALQIADLAKSIPVPYVRTSVSQIGGPHRASTIVTVGFDPRETWTNGIFENSRYARFDVSPGPQFSPYAGKSTTEPTIELISGHGVPKFRKARFKTPAEAIAKIAKWASEAGGAKRNPVVRRHKTVGEMRAAGVPDYFEKIQKRGEVYRPSTMLYESGEQRPVAGHSGHFISSSGNALMHLRPVGSDPDDTEITVRGLYDAYGRRKNPASTVGHLLADVRAALPGWPIQPDNGRVIVIGARPEVARQRLVALGYNAKIVPANAYGEPAHVVVSASRSNPAKRRNPVPRASKAGPSGPRYGSGPERYYISDTTAQHHARHLAPMTDENDHAGARLYLARTVLASPTFEEKVKDGNARMDRSHTSAHYNDNEAAWKANHALLKRMLAQVKRRTTPAGYAAIHGAL
jgi:hypothetical protein